LARYGLFLMLFHDLGTNLFRPSSSLNMLWGSH
jgi:hypothetical protein